MVKMRHMKQVLAFVLVLAMFVTAFPALAVSGSAEETSFETDGFSAADALKLVQTLAKTIPENAFGEAVSWGTGKILDAVFGESLSSAEAAAFQSILAGIGELKTAVSNLQTGLDIQSLGDLLNAVSMAHPCDALWCDVSEK